MASFRNFVQRVSDRYVFELQVQRDVQDERHRAQAVIPRRMIRDRLNPLEAFHDKQFLSIYGLSKDAFVFILNRILPLLKSSENTNAVFLTPPQKFSLFLDFLRTNSFQRVISTQHHHQVSQGRACIWINEIASILAGIQKDFIELPSLEEADEISEAFQSQNGFPFVFGLIDGTHIEITKPVEAGLAVPAERFYNRKGYFSINCMMVCDNNFRIRHVSCRHAGSAHDSKIFNESHLKALLDARFDPHKPRVLLGDEGYPCSKVLLTPIRQDRVETDKEASYNRAHKKTRIGIEHTFGILKKRFPALLYQLRSRKLRNIQNIIVAACVLHNLIIQLREDPPSLPPTVQQATFQDRLQRGQVQHRANGRPILGNFDLRNSIVQEFF